jgi:1,4-dihydroxy-2-naphthoate octaprenyltransferase
MIQHQHNHDYGLGRLLSRVFWGAVIVFWMWVLVVLLFEFPWILLLAALIVVAGLVYVANKNEKRANRE